VTWQLALEEHAAQEPSRTNAAIHPKAAMAKAPRTSLKPSSRVMKTHYTMTAAAKSCSPLLPTPSQEDDDNSILDSTADEVLGLGMDDEKVEEASPTSVQSSESWRKHGKMYRAELVLLDEEKGGNTFVLSNNCSIDRYYRVAERVSTVGVTGRIFAVFYSSVPCPDIHAL
jgi:hypothetical protein